MKQIKLTQGTPEWHEWRKSGIGSSDIAKIMGVSPFGTALTVYNEKAGLSEPAYQSAAMSLGVACEPRALELFNGSRFNFKPTCFESTEYPFFKASLDGYDAGTMVEIKTPGKKDLQLARDGVIPDYYKAQMQWQLFVAECPIGWYVCYDHERDEIVEIPIQADSESASLMKTAAIKFWQDFLMGIPPADQKKDRKFITCPEFEKLANDGKRLKYALEIAEADYNIWKKQVLQYGEDCTFTGHGLTVFRTAPRVTYDVDAMKNHGIDINQFKRVSEPGWRIAFDK